MQIKLKKERDFSDKQLEATRTDGFADADQVMETILSNNFMLGQEILSKNKKVVRQANKAESVNSNSLNEKAAPVKKNGKLYF